MTRASTFAKAVSDARSASGLTSRLWAYQDTRTGIDMNVTTEGALRVRMNGFGDDYPAHVLIVPPHNVADLIYWLKYAFDPLPEEEVKPA